VTIARTADVPLTLEGAPANLATRSMAFFLDIATIAAVFALGSAVTERMLDLVLGRTVQLDESVLLYRLAFAGWALLYCAYPLAVAGRTFGMAVVGLRAVRPDGTDLEPWRAVLRTLALPLSFLAFGLGFALIVLRRDHRALHDLIGGSSVIYSWEARASGLWFLTRTSSG
jgi:uncharacterized RDD family membrane protein YckC